MCVYLAVVSNGLHTDNVLTGGSNSGDYTIFLTDPADADVEDRLYDPNKPLPSSSTTSSSTSNVATSTVTRQGKDASHVTILAPY